MHTSVLTMDPIHDDALLTFEEVDRATVAAEWTVPGGRVHDIDRAAHRVDAHGAAFAVEIADLGGARWNVYLRPDFSVIEVERR